MSERTEHPGERPRSRVVHCYAEGRPGEWEAVCLDLDIAVQGESLDAVIRTLTEAIRTHLEDVAALPEAERAGLVYRPVPWSLRLRVIWRIVRALMRGDGRGNQGRADFTLPASA